MRRRDFLGVLSGVAAWPIAAHAQQPERIRRVGVLMPFTNQDFVDRDDVVAFTQEFRRLGWEQGRNFQLEYRGVAPHISQLQTTAAELVGLKPEVILVLGGAALKAVQANDNSIPIVFVGVTDPAEQGFVANLEHPGGNLTGFAVFESSVCSKWLQLLKEILPDLKHFAVIYNPETTTGNWLPLIKSIAQGLGLEVNEAAVYVEDDIDNVLGPLKTTSNAGVIVLPSAFTMLHRQRIIDFAGRWQLPAVYWNNRFVKVGGLMSYAYNLDAQEREGVTYVDRILKGEKPGNLPVQETTRFELVVNLKTAKALGITVPMSLIARADEVIE
jgi:putative tryptophan/tyrosine transport system substrate-binding protein